MKRVKVVQCSHEDAWYKDRIGEAFDVEPFWVPQVYQVQRGDMKGRNLHQKDVASFISLEEVLGFHSFSQEIGDYVAEIVLGWHDAEHPELHGGTGQMMAEYEYGVYYYTEDAMLDPEAKWDEANFQERLGWNPQADLVQAFRVLDLIKAQGWPGNLWGRYLRAMKLLCRRFGEPEWGELEWIYATLPSEEIPLRICQALLIAAQELDHD